MVRKFIKKLGDKVFDRRKKPAPAQAPAHSGGKDRKPNRPGSAHPSPRRQWSLDDFQVPILEDSTRFHDFNIPLPIMHAIHDMDFKYCTPIQTKVLAHLATHRNIAGRAQTGTGKTAAFLIGMFERFLADGRQQHKPGIPRGLVLAPTRELAIQILKDANDLGRYCKFHCTAVYGGMDFDKQRREVMKQPIDLVVATPGRLLDFMQRRLLDLKHLQILVIDEADRMLDMGFIPDVRRIIRATPPKNIRQTMLFSATLTDDVLRLASQWMPDPIICEVDTDGIAVSTVNQIIYIVESRDKFNLLYNLLTSANAERVLLFGNRRDTTQRLSQQLIRHGIPCEYLSGAVRQEKRLKILEAFRRGDVRIVVATDVAGRGLHVDNISHVINYEFPYDPEDYVHRIGRTARAGVEGTAISFACEHDSFAIPDIEKYLGTDLPCTVPGPDLLKPPTRTTSRRH